MSEQLAARTDADLLRLIAKDHERLAPNAHHTAETLRQIADRLTAPTRDGEVGRLRKWLKHDGLCGIVGGYGYCTCGLDAALATQAEGVDRG